MSTEDLSVRLPFGIRLAACHGLPILVVGLCVAVTVFFMFAAMSRFVPPVTLTAIGLYPEPVEVGEKVLMAKAGRWNRLCPSYAVETYFDSNLNGLAWSGKHNIDVPKVLGEIKHEPRPVSLPREILNNPGTYYLRLDVYSVCWPWEAIWPIPSTSAETTFAVVAAN
jgi:hypothetical protein